MAVQAAGFTAASCAQRRPGFESRRHATRARARSHSRPPLNEGRGSNPGDTRLPIGGGTTAVALNEGRGSNPGDTPRPWWRLARSRSSLNEGRGSNPGDTLALIVGETLTLLAQRRPGFESRRHEESMPQARTLYERSTKAGVRIPATPRLLLSTWMARRSAQRRPGFESRRHPINRPSSSRRTPAQRRPGFESRRHPA